MIALGRFSVSRPKHVLAAWLVLVAVLGFLGMGLEQDLHRSNLTIPGTPSYRADQLTQERFGQSFDLLVLLNGPRAALDQQGPLLAAALERRSALKVIDPWTARLGSALRPKPGVAVLLVRAERNFNEVSRRIVPEVRADVRRFTRAPLQAHVSGYADIAAGIATSSIGAIRQAELIAGPALLLVLLLVFRSVVAAALPLFIGFMTIGAGRGVLELINVAAPLDVLALNLTSMMGLALGVDYALLVVSRLREELAGGADSGTAALRAVETAGRTVLFAGMALTAAMVGALFVAPGNLLMSATIGVVVAVVLSVLAALTVLPATVALLGPRIDRWSIGQRRQGGTAGVAGLALRALRHPAVASAVVLGAIAVLAAPTITLEVGPPDPRVLPPGTRERDDYEAVQRTLAQGWTAPYKITLAARSGTVNYSQRLAATEQLRPVALRRDVAAIIAPAQIDSSGSAAQIVVIGKGNVDRAGNPLRRYLAGQLKDLERKTGLDARLGGPAATLQDFESETLARDWLLVLVLMGVTYLVLVPLLRSLVLPLLAVLLTGLAVAAAFGVLVILFQGDAPLGGPGFIDAITVSSILTIVFGLSIDYEVFLLARMREGYARTGSTEGAIAYGLRHTAGVIIGAALIMTAVFVAFALAPIANMRQLGIGLTVAVLLDATLVRLVLLPAAIRLVGDASWRLPGWLDRLLPDVPRGSSLAPHEGVTTGNGHDGWRPTAPVSSSQRQSDPTGISRMATDPTAAATGLARRPERPQPTGGGDVG